MTMLIAGLILWTVVHFIPSLAAGIKLKWRDRLGDNGYAGSFAILIVTALLLIVFGWRSTVPSHLYSLPAFTHTLALLLMVAAFVLFGAAKHPTRIKQLVRHPQLSSVVVWSVAHLLLNGDSRSVLLFSWMGVWAVLEMLAINKRDGAWQKPAVPSWAVEVRGWLISLIIFAVVVALHPYLAGVAVH
ncbi:MAG: NnrU family protein [Spongiibacteraceae bacterium]